MIDIRKARELLITIDMVNGFVKEGALAAPSIMRIVPRQIELLEEAMEKDIGLIFVRDSHPENAIEFGTYGKHCLEGTSETEVIEELMPYVKKENTYFKNSTNLIFAPNLQNDLLEMDYLERIYLMGCLSEVCVENGAIGLRTFFDQLNKDIEICIYPDAIDTYNAPGHNADDINNEALKRMASNGIKVLEKRR